MTVYTRECPGSMLTTFPFTATISTSLKVPFQMRGLPGFQSEIASHPNMYCFVHSGFVNASQTFVAGALMVISFFTTRGVLIVVDYFSNSTAFGPGRIAFYGFFLVTSGVWPNRFLKALLKCWGVE